MKHFQCRLVKQIKGTKIITFLKQGKMYSHGQKTLKSQHSLEEATAEAIKFNPTLPPEVKGIVIVNFNATTDPRIYEGKVEKAFIRQAVRKKGTTDWQRFINRKGEIFELDPKKHTILNKIV